MREVKIVALVDGRCPVCKQDYTGDYTAEFKTTLEPIRTVVIDDEHCDREMIMVKLVRARELLQKVAGGCTCRCGVSEKRPCTYCQIASFLKRGG